MIYLFVGTVLWRIHVMHVMTESVYSAENTVDSSQPFSIISHKNVFYFALSRPHIVRPQGHRTKLFYYSYPRTAQISGP